MNYMNCMRCGAEMINTTGGNDYCPKCNFSVNDLINDKIKFGGYIMASFNINAIFTDGSDELNLYSISIDETSDKVEITTNVRQPALKRGSIGDLIFVSKSPLDGTEVRDVHKDVLLQCIEVWKEEIGEPTEWRYIFLKN